VRRRFLRVPRPRASTICLGSRWCASKPLVAEVEGLNSNLVEFLPVDLPVAVLSAPTKRSFRGMPPRSRLTSEVHRLNPLLSIACSMAARRRLLRDGIVPMDAGAAAGVTPSRAREFWHGGARDQDPGR